MQFTHSELLSPKILSLRFYNAFFKSFIDSLFFLSSNLYYSNSFL